jgi:hypothetical protein
LDTATAQTLLLFLIAIGLTLLVGQILLRSGERFLRDVFENDGTARSVNRLVSVVFHLVTLGLLAIISTVEFPVDGMVQTVVTKTGIILLVLGITYGLTMLALMRIRERRQAAGIQERVQQRLSDRGVATTPPPPATPDPRSATPDYR